jgi:hypothetical protein
VPRHVTPAPASVEHSAEAGARGVGDQLVISATLCEVSRGTTCFSWLSSHPGEYGLYNLPTQSWHWSTTGKGDRWRSWGSVQELRASGVSG